MTLIAIAWDDAAGRDRRGAVRLLDQTLLPGITTDRVLDTTDGLVTAIAELAVRGAPALGVAGALGVVLAMDEGPVRAGTRRRCSRRSTGSVMPGRRRSTWPGGSTRCVR